MVAIMPSAKLPGRQLRMIFVVSENFPAFLAPDVLHGTACEHLVLLQKSLFLPKLATLGDRTFHEAEEISRLRILAGAGGMDSSRIVRAGLVKISHTVHLKTLATFFPTFSLFRKCMLHRPCEATKMLVNNLL
jgi:hypothetical protein